MLIGHTGNPWQLQQFKTSPDRCIFDKRKQMNTVHKQFEKNNTQDKIHNYKRCNIINYNNYLYNITPLPQVFGVFS